MIRLFFYNLYNEKNKTKITFNHLVNDTNIPFMKNRQILDLIGTDHRNSLIFYNFSLNLIQYQ